MKISPAEIREVDELEPLLAKNPEYIEPGMKVLERQLTIGTGRLDLLSLDDQNTVCVVELKRKSEERQLLQALQYYDWVKANMGWLHKVHSEIDTTSEPRLILIAQNFSDDLKRAAKYTTLNANELLALKQYKAFKIDEKEISVICSDVDIGETPEEREIPSVEAKVSYVQSEKVRALLQNALGSLKSRGFDIRAIGGKAMSGFYKEKRILRLYPRKQWFVGKAMNLDGEWSSSAQIQTEDQWTVFFEKEVKPIIDAIESR